MANVVSVPLPKDLPENWNDNQYVSPGGTEVGLTEKHGYNYLMKQVNATQKAVDELDEWLGAPHKNLLHNWDFRNPVDQKQTYIVAPGTPYFSDASLSTKAGDTTDYYRVNKVNDTYGTMVINAVTYYVSWASAVRGNFNHAVGIERWSINPGSQMSVLFVQSGGILARLSPGHGRMSQSVTTATSVPPSIFAGKIVTASVKVESLTKNGCYLYVNDGVTQFGVRLTSVGTFKVTGTISAAPTGVGVVIQNTDESEYCDIKISAIKLELGNASSLDNDPPADYAEQAAICAQYNTLAGDYMGAVPSGFVEGGLISIVSDEDLTNKLELLLLGMPNTKTKFVMITFVSAHPVLGGGNRVLRIDKITENYAVIQSLGYTNDGAGVVMEHFRSKFNGVWTSWARTYNTYFKPSFYEVGAFGALSDSTTTIDLNAHTIIGSKRVANATNKPGGTGIYGFVWNITSASELCIVQYYLDAESRKLYRRCRVDLVWTSWVAEASTTVVNATLEQEV